MNPILSKGFNKVSLIGCIPFEMSRYVKYNRNIFIVNLLKFTIAIVSIIPRKRYKSSADFIFLAHVQAPASYLRKAYNS